MSLLFKTIDFDILYASIADILKNEHPIQNDETIQEWYKRLLYELMAYIEAKYEPIENIEVIEAKKKENKKKDTPDPTDPIENETLFSDNLEKALEIVSQDPKFGIYLLAWWLPILVSPTDWFEICMLIDCSQTPAKNVAINSLEIRIDNMYSQIKILGVNGKKLSNLRESEYNTLMNDAFYCALIKAIHKYKYNTSIVDYNSVKKCDVIEFDINDASVNSFKLANFLYDVHNVSKVLFITTIVLKSNLITEQDNKIKLIKNLEVPRKKFNARKFLKAETLTQDEMSTHIIETLVVSIFKTYYDYDKGNINKDLFNYLFLNDTLNNIN